MMMTPSLFADTPGSPKHSSFLFISVRHGKIIYWWQYSEDGCLVIKNQLPLRPLSLVAGEEVSRGFPGGLRVVRVVVVLGSAGGGATAGPPGRLQIHLSLYRCRGILMVRLVLHFNKLSWECRHSVQTEKRKSTISHFSYSEIGDKQAGWRK